MKIFDYVPGEKISVPGIYRGVPMDVYHGDCCIGTSISSGHLRTAESKSLDEVWDKFYLNPDRDPDESDKTYFILGRAGHTLLLGEEGFRTDYLIRPETYPDDDSKAWSGNSKSCKAWLAEAALAGKTVITKKQVETIRGIAKRLAAHPTIQTGILNGLIEHSLFWVDEKTGLWLKARPDAIPTDSNIFSDLKISSDVTANATRRAINEHGYHQQMALIAEGIYVLTGRAMDEAVLIFAKASRPYSINHKPLATSAMNRGWQQNRRALDRIAEALKSGYWPGPDDDEVPAHLPDYREKQLKFEEEHRLLPPVEDSTPIPQPAADQATDKPKKRTGTQPIEMPADEPAEAI